MIFATSIMNRMDDALTLAVEANDTDEARRVFERYVESGWIREEAWHVMDMFIEGDCMEFCNDLPDDHDECVNSYNEDDWRFDVDTMLPVRRVSLEDIDRDYRDANFRIVQVVERGSSLEHDQFEKVGFG